MTELQLLAWLGFFVYLSRRRGNTEEIVHYYNSGQLAAVHIKRQRKSCLMTKTDSRLQIWTSWCFPASNMKDRKYLTCAAFGKQEKIWRSGMALLHLLINLFLIVGFFLFLFFFPHEQWEDEAALLPAARRWSLPARRMSPSARLSTAVHHPARAEVGLGVTLSTAPAALGQAVIMSIP